MKRWLAQFDVSEDEPTWANAIAAGALFVILLILAYVYLLVLAP